MCCALENRQLKNKVFRILYFWAIMVSLEWYFCFLSLNICLKYDALGSTVILTSIVYAVMTPRYIWCLSPMLSMLIIIQDHEIKYGTCH